jgi:hypothetical protein
MAAWGRDFTKVTLLAAHRQGRPGPQSVVINFVSGLILLVERPIAAGDAVQVGDALGVVRSIGVRASMIRTAEGAGGDRPQRRPYLQARDELDAGNRKRQIAIDVAVALRN